ncbi:Electron transport complex, RnfA [Candidatus Magnetoovum chiemensis]|nr:Electron transport complex, RnfA [Candidatus Magnetoovum chiemensis]
MRDLFLIFFAIAIVNNVILAKFLGLCAFFGVSQDLKPAVSMGLALTFVLTLSSAASWIVNEFVLVPYNVEFLQTIVFIVVIAALVQFVEMFISKYAPLIQKALGIYLPLLTTNCSVLGVCLLNVKDGLTFIETIVQGLGAGIGYMLAICIMAGIRARLVFSNVPKPMQGLPISFIVGALLALSFFGFQGFLSH